MQGGDWGCRAVVGGCRVADQRCDLGDHTRVDSLAQRGEVHRVLDDVLVVGRLLVRHRPLERVRPSGRVVGR